MRTRLEMLEGYLDDQGEEPLIELKVEFLRAFVLEVNARSTGDAALRILDKVRSADATWHGGDVYDRARQYEVAIDAARTALAADLQSTGA